MSTTVSYKGQTLATVSNQTKTLLTDGKYLEDDITLVDVSGGGAVLTTKNISANGTYNASSDSADGYSQVNVAVPASAVDTGTKNITANGSNQDVVGYAAVDVAVPNSYSASDEGKVVSNGALVAQTAHADVTPTTSEQTIDTTTNNSIKVKGDADLVAGNIKKDVEIFGVTGSYEGGGGGFSWDDFSDYSKPSGGCVYTGNEVPPYFAFRRTGLTSFTGDNVTSFGAYGGQRNSFIGCTSLESVSFANYSGTIYSSLFTNCSSLETASFPKAVTVEGNYVFNGCASLVGIVLPSLNGRISSQYFVDSACVAFKYLDIGCTQTVYGIMQNAFNGASNFDTLIIRGTSVNTLANINAFSNTKFASGGSGGTLYVPSSLMSNYQSASNWSTIIGYSNNQIKAIEGSYYETHYADGTVIS